jgi:hypothetical protein
MIIAINLGDIVHYYHLDHAAICYYRLEPGDIDIISLTHAAIYDYRLEPGAIDIIIALTLAQFMIITLNQVVSDIIIALTHARSS